MDLNKPISLSFSLQGSSIQHAKVQVALIAASVLAIVYFIYGGYGAFSNLEVHTTNKAEYERLLQEQRTVNTKYHNLFKNNADYFELLKAAPKSKSEMAGQLAALVSKHHLKLSKLNTNDTQQPATQNNNVEIEADGAYPAVIAFLKDMKAVTASSEVQGVKLSKNLDNPTLKVSLNIKFNQPPAIESHPIKQSTLLPKGWDFDTFDRWQVMQAGFVPAPQEPSATPDASQAPSRDPFAVPEKSKEQPKHEAGPVGAVPDSSGVASTEGVREQRIKAFYLSGIIYSKDAKFCVITLPSGESKVFSPGAKVGNRFKVESIGSDHIVINWKKTSKVEVGGEIQP